MLLDRPPIADGDREVMAPAVPRCANQLPDMRFRAAAVVVDDGLATGATARAALQAMRRRGLSRLVLAVPVAPPDTLAALRREADDVVCLVEAEIFSGIGAFYADFHQLEDAEVLRLLEAAAARQAAVQPGKTQSGKAPSTGPDPET